MTRTAFPLDVTSRAVHDVREMDLGPRAMGEWSCTRCNTWFPAGHSYQVRFGSSGQFSFIACPDCAEKYQLPQTVVIDLQAVARANADDLEALFAIVAEAERARGRGRDGHLTLRAADVRAVASDLGTTPRELVIRLQDAGLLAPA